MSLTPAPALEKGLKIMEIIAKEEPISFNQLQQLTGFNVSSLNRYLHTLRQCDYIQKNTNNKYIIGLKFFSLAGKNNRWQSLKQTAKKYLVQLSEAFGISLLLIGYSNDQYIVLTKQAHRDNITMMSIDACHYYEESLVWALPYIVHMDNIEEARNIDAYLKTGKMSRENMEQLKSHFLEQDFVLDNGYVNKNIIRIGIPIYAGESKPVAVLGAGTFKQHVEDSVEEIIRTMQEVSAKISELVF